MASQPILDQTLDLNGREQFRLVQLFEAPDFVKTASSSSLSDQRRSSHICVATRDIAAIPMHSKAACWMSSAFFFDKQAELPRADAAKIEARLLEAADFWSIRPAFESLKKRAAAMAQDDLSRLPDEDFAWIQGHERQLPLRNALEVKAAAEYVTRWRDEFIFGDRQKMARAILQKAAQMAPALVNTTKFSNGSPGSALAQPARRHNSFVTEPRSPGPRIRTSLPSWIEWLT